jgi:hypothetical protein
MEQLLLRGAFRLTPRMQIVQIISILLCGIACTIVTGWMAAMRESTELSERLI